MQAPGRPERRYQLARGGLTLLAHGYSHIEVEGLGNVPLEPVLYCFSHQCWIDPMYVLAVLPRRPRIYFFGPEQSDMRRGARNRLMRWFGLVIPFAPGARGLLAATDRSAKLARGGASIAISGEGRIHCGEETLLPLKDGAAYIALRAGIPIVPLAINGTGWLGFRRRIRVRAGAPLRAVAARPGRPRSEESRELTSRLEASLASLVREFPEQPEPGRVGRWLTELFNDWPEGRRPGAGPV